MIWIDGFAIDAAISQEPTFDADVTEYPVEKGAATTDHVRAKPVTFVVEGIVSDTPIGEVAELRDTGAKPSYEARNRLFEIWNSREPVTVETENAVFENMVLHTFSTPEDATTGEACRFRAAFKQLRLVTNKRTSVPVAVPRARKKVNLGTKPSPPATGGEGGAQPPPEKSQQGASTLYSNTFGRSDTNVTGGLQ